MAYQNKKQTQAPEQNEKQHPEEQHTPEQAVFGMSNSYLLSSSVTPPPGAPNSIMREMIDRYDPAEAEADRLSAGIRYGTPNSVRHQMGSRLGADFSSVRFHTDSESIRRNAAMGARAYTRGSDVYFGKGGFDPAIGAHELVHTVQQRAVPGRVSQSAAYGTVQMFSIRDLLSRISNRIHRKKAAKSAAGEDHREVIPEEAAAVESAAPETTAAEAPKPVDPKVESEVKEGLRKDGEDKRTIGSTTDRDKKMMADADALEAQLHDLMDAPPSKKPPAGADAPPVVEEPSGPPSSPAEKDPKKIVHADLGKDDDDTDDAPAVLIPAGTEEGKPPAVSKPATSAPPVDLSVGTTSSSGKSPVLVPGESRSGAEGAAVTREDLPDNLKILEGDVWQKLTIDDSPTTTTTKPQHPDGVEVHYSSKYRRDYAFNKDGQLEVLTGTGWHLAVPESSEITGSGTKEVLPSWEGNRSEEVKAEKKPVSRRSRLRRFFHRSGRYHGQSKATGVVNEGVGYVNAGNDIVKIFKGADDLVDFAGTNELRWGGKDVHTASYDANEGPVLTGATSLAGAGTAAVSTVTNLMDTKRHVQNIAAGESGADAAQKAMDTAASAGAVLSHGAKFLETVGAVAPVTEFIPGVNVAAGALTGLSGASQAIRGAFALHRIKNEIKGLEHRANVRKRSEEGDVLPDGDMDEAPLAGGTSSSAPDSELDEDEDSSAVSEPSEEEAVIAGESPQGEKPSETQDQREKRLLQIFRHGQWVSEYNRTAGAMKAGSGAITLTSGVLTLTGAGAAVGAGLAAANAGLGVGRFAYDKIKKRHIRHRVIAQELGVSEKDVEEGTDNYTGALSRKQLGGSKKEVFGQIKRIRAKYLLDQAGRDKPPDGSDPDAVAADNVIRALGVHRKKDGSYAPGAEELLAEKLG